MVFDPEFCPVPMTKPGPKPRRRWPGRLLIPLLLLSGCHSLLTGSPIPLWHIEHLDHPIAVKAIDPEALVLADGRRVRLPFIKRLPRNNPVFVRVLSHGVEISRQGRVIGLIDPRRMCGNDPVAFYRQRIDLGKLAGLLDPDGIDDAIVLAEAIQFHKDNYGCSRDCKRMPFYVLSQARRFGEMYEAAMNRRERERSPLIFTIPN